MFGSIPRPPAGRQPAAALSRPADDTADGEMDSLFERFPWLYIFCREHLFRDDTERIAAALWPTGAPPARSHLLELGCGPGFYACRLAARFAHLRVTGIDRSQRQLRRARARARAGGLDCCRFAVGDGRALAWPDDTFDVAISPRLFTILPERERVLAELHRVLSPGGRLFVAEPRSALRAGAPLRVMWLLARLADPLSNGCRGHGRYREPDRVAVLTIAEFEGLLASQPWGRARCWRDAHYHYALCEKRPCAAADRNS